MATYFTILLYVKIIYWRLAEDLPLISSPQVLMLL